MSHSPKKETFSLTGSGEIENVRLWPEVSLRINPNFIEYLYDDHIVFVCGTNLVIYDIYRMKQKFLIRRNNQLKITYLSVGYVGNSRKKEALTNTSISNLKQSQKASSSLTASKIFSDRLNQEKFKDILIFLGEYSEKESMFYITVIKPSNPKEQYTIKSTGMNWKINFGTILNNSAYCVTISQKQTVSKKTPTHSRLSFAKYTFETFVSQETIQEDLTYVCYNPKNTIELVVCGKGYLRLWNVFINEGSLKEHQQRFLRGKQEKEHNFIKAQFFDKKPFLLIVGTTENLFYIIDSFQVIHELNVCYSYENIFDLNVQNFVTEEESDDITELKSTLDSITKNDLDAKLKELSALTSSNTHKRQNSEDVESEGDMVEEEKEETGEHGEENSEEQKSNKDVFRRLYKAKEKEESDGKVEKGNKVRFFELINDNLLFVIYQNDGILLLYKIDWNRKIVDGESEMDNKKWNVIENRVIRVAKNIKTISGFSMYKPRNDIILLVESFLGNAATKRHKATETTIFKMRRNIINEKTNPNAQQISFEHKLFSGFFENSAVKEIAYNEKKGDIFIAQENGVIKCFDVASKEYIISQQLPDKIVSISSSSSNNLLAVAHPNKVSIMSRIKDRLTRFCELEVKEPLVKWSSKGDIIAIGGVNRKDVELVAGRKKTYCVFFVDTFTFNTFAVIENLSHKIVQMKFVEHDKYIFIMLENSYIIGWFINRNINSLNMLQMMNEKNEDVNLQMFKLVFTFNPKGKQITCFDYDESLKVVVALSRAQNKLLICPHNAHQKKKTSTLNSSSLSSSQTSPPTLPYVEINNVTLTSLRIIKELHVLIAGDADGSVKIYQWPFINYNVNYSIENLTISLEQNFKTCVNIVEGMVREILPSSSSREIITVSTDNLILINSVQIMKRNEYRDYELFPPGCKPQIELMIPPRMMYEMKIEDIVRKERNVEILSGAMIKMKQTMECDIDEIRNIHKTEVENMENNLKQNTDDEQQKYENIEKEIETLKANMAMDLSKRVDELEKDKVLLTNKYKEKIDLYESEISRLKNELQGIKTSIEEKYQNEVTSQKEFYENLLGEYNAKYNKIKTETDASLVTLVNLSAEYDEAIDKIVTDYKQLVTNLDQKIAQTKEINDNLLKERDEKLREAKALEDEHKEKLEQKVKESDKLIEKNVEIKQSIINATQRTITFQEQLLETEKNLLKIDKKLEDLISKNKHLEQIRFVLEHRMTSLEKEKEPLEGQCSFLENQKNKLTEEFNKIILQINMHNQQLENKQSQLRASLIQNYEIHDQKNYVESKLSQLKGEIEQFLMNYQEENTTSLNENKATKVALNFKKFYDKYFTNTIEDELANYQFYAAKLQEQTDKDGIANNFDLIMRNKAEEKLICEKEKVEELKNVKEKGFRRMQNENTILIAECNRLRKSLHEIYMHVVDIEQKFETLTKINPKLPKSEIVSQIKEFIQKTHQKIKENYSKAKQIKQRVIVNKSRLESDLRGDSSNIIAPTGRASVKEESKSPAEPETGNGYDGIIKLPEIKNKSMSFLSQNKQDIFDNNAPNQNKSENGTITNDKDKILPKIEA